MYNEGYETVEAIWRVVLIIWQQQLLRMTKELGIADRYKAEDRTRKSVKTVRQWSNTSACKSHEDKDEENDIYMHE